MTGDDFHRRAKDVFGAVVDLPVDARTDELSARCGTDAALRREVEDLLAHNDRPLVDLRPAPTLVRDALSSAGHDSARVPARLGEYRIEALLGEGGMGVVYRAEQERPRRTVALKVMRPGFAGRQVLKRFQRETELLGRLPHPNIAQIFEAGNGPLIFADGAESASVAWFAMEMVRGRSIVEHCREAHLSRVERVRLMVKVCDAVEYAHRHGVVHRDLKPANLLVDERGEPRVLDFGIARAIDADALGTIATETGQVIGTLPYMSPEQLTGTTSAVDPRSDIYALGVIFYQLLTDRLPLDVTKCSVPEAIRAVTHDDPPGLATIDRSLRGDLDTIVAKCLEKDKHRRYASVGLLVADLHRHLDHRPIEARPPSTLYNLKKFTRRHRALVMGTAIAFVALVVAVIAVTIWGLKAKAAELRAIEHLEIAEREQRRSEQTFNLFVGMLSAADPSKARGKEITLRETLDNGLKSIEDANATEPEVQAMMLHSLGYVYWRLGDLPTAERVLRKSVELHRSIENRTGPWILDSLQKLVLVLRETGHLAEAIPLAQEFYDISLQAYGEHDPRLVRALNALAILKNDTGDYAGAVTVYRRALANLEANGLADHPTEIVVTVNLATALQHQGNDEEAARLYEHTLAIEKKAWGDDAPLVATNLNNLGTALRSLGRLSESHARYAEALEIRTKVLPENHPERIAANVTLANSLNALGRPHEALPYGESGAAQTREAFGGDSPATARADLQLAVTLAALGRTDEALAKARDARRIDASAETAATVGRIALDAGQLDEAEAALTFAQTSYRAALGESHRTFIGTLRDQGRLALARRDVDGAVATLRSAVAGLRGVLKPQHPSLAHTLEDLAIAEMAARHRDEAVRAAREAEAIWKARTPDVLWRIAEAQALAALALEDNAAFDAALAIMESDRAAPANLARLRALRR